MSVKKSLPSSAIKMIALITMFTDHMGYALGRTGFLFIPRILGLTTDPYIVSEWVWLVFRSVGRIAFPLFCFMLVEGFFHTGSHRRHLILLGSFALISEIPFNLFFRMKISYLPHQNTLFTLFMAYVGLLLLDRCTGDYRFLAFLFPLAAEFLHTDYGAEGVFTVYLFYLAARRKGGDLSRAGAADYFLALCPLLMSALSWKVEICRIISLPILLLYNGEKGWSRKYFFYLFYPLHLLALYLLRLRL